MDIFVISVPLEILSHYPDVDISNWPRIDAQGNIDNLFREKHMV